jgi:hypothetical protein
MYLGLPGPGIAEGVTQARTLTHSHTCTYTHTHIHTSYTHSTPAASPLGAVADLALDLVRGLVGVGMHDAAQPLARLMLNHAAQLSPRQLSALGTCMAELDMRRELPLLLARG